MNSGSSDHPAPGSQFLVPGSGPVCQVKKFANRVFRASPLVAKASPVPVNPHICPPNISASLLVHFPTSGTGGVP